MPLVLLVPGLLDVDAAVLAACAPLSRVAARAAGEWVDDAEAELLRALGIEAATAPFAALGAGLQVGSDWVARADPVSTLVSHEDVRIVARVDDLADEEARSLAALLDRHFADDGLAFAAPRPDAWFVHSREPHAVTLLPLAAAVDRPLRERLPAGDDAKRWRRWWTEVQMLLHEQPVALRDRFPVNALWFSCGGRLPAQRPAAIAVHATATRHGDVLRGVAQLAGTQAAPLHAWRAAGTARQAVVADPVATASLARFASTLLEPALDALDRGEVDRLVLIADGRTGAARWSLVRAGLIERLWRRTAAFAPPARDDR